jgi:peroxiredoxin Q/BCP
VRWAAGISAAGIVTAALYGVFTHSSGSNAAGGFQVGSPGPGQRAPGFTLDASTGRPISLGDYTGKTVLLYFQEGLTCQPCWDQIADLETDAAAVHAAGIDQILSITTDPVGLITRKTHDEHLSTPVLSDPDLAVSRAYEANSYGMMGTSRDGHSFVLVGPDGVIRWRRDYGGAPKYTMYVPPAALLADLAHGQRPAGAA